MNNELEEIICNLKFQDNTYLKNKGQDETLFKICLENKPKTCARLFVFVPQVDKWLHLTSLNLAGGPIQLQINKKGYITLRHVNNNGSLSRPLFLSACYGWYGHKFEWIHTSRWALRYEPQSHAPILK